MRVLAIDDDLSTLILLKELFAQEGIEGHFATDGARGVTLAGQLRPDAVVVDIRMPGIDGWEVANRLREDPETALIPIVFCSAMDDDHTVWRGWKCGASSYVPKFGVVPLLARELQRIARPGAGGRRSA